MRTDAARRRAAVLREARRAFATTGADVALEAIAEAAGVGIATLYRNFESRAVLVEEVALAILDDLRAVTADAAAELATDPGRVWREYVGRLVDLDLGALTAALAQELPEGLAGPVREAQDAALTAVDAFLVDVRAAGLLHADLGALELVVVVGIVTRPQPEVVREAAPHLVDRLVSIVLAGLRADAAPS